MNKPEVSTKPPLVLFQQINSKAHAMHPIKNTTFIAAKPFRGNEKAVSKKLKNG